MKNRGTVLWLLFAVIVLAAVHLMLDYFGVRSDEHAVRPALLDSRAVITSLTIERQGASPVGLVLDEEWRLTSPVSGLADRKAVLRLVDALVTAPVNDAFTEPELLKLGRTRADFLLDSPRFAVTAVSSAGVSRRIVFGGPTPAGDEVYAAVDGIPAVCAVPSETLSAIDIPLDGFRLKTLFRRNPQSVTLLTLRNSQGRLRKFRRDAEGWKSDGETASEEKLDELFSALFGTEAEEFVWPKGTTNETVSVTADMLASYGLDPESSAMAVLGEREDSQERITFGKDAKDGAVYALIDNGAAIVTVPRRVEELVSGDLGRFFDNRLFPLEAAKVRSLVLSEGDRICALSLDSATGEWTLESPVVAPADRKTVDSIVNRLTALSSADVSANGVSVSLSTNSEPVTVSRAALFDGLRFEDLRSREILRVEPEQIRRIVRTPGHEGKPVSITCSRDTRTWRLENAEEKAIVNTENLGRLLSELNPLRAVRIEKLKVSANELAAYGLEKPELTIAIDRAESDSIRRNLFIGDAVKGGRYATVGYSEAVFVLSEDTVKRLSAKLLE